MKSTIKTLTNDVVINPLPGVGFIQLYLVSPFLDIGGNRASVCLTRDQVEALVFGLEAALESAMPLPSMGELVKV